MASTHQPLQLSQCPESHAPASLNQFPHPTTYHAHLRTSNASQTATTSSAISIPSSRNSPMSIPSTMDRNASLQTSPESLVPSPFPSASLPTSLTLPESYWTSPVPSQVAPSPSLMSEAAQSSKGPGLIRRISRTARFRRRRGSAANSQRDNSVGPTILRRRSDSRGVGDGTEISDLELGDNDDLEEMPEYSTFYGSHVNALGITSGAPIMRTIPEGGVTAPVRSSELLEGIILLKYTKRKHKSVRFRLDEASAKVSWETHGKTRSVYIDDIKELRTGEDARSYREECGVPAHQEQLWFTIAYICDDDRSKGRKTKYLHLLAHDRTSFDMWTRHLNETSRSRYKLMTGLAGTAEKSAITLWRKTMEKRFNGQPHSAEEERLDFPDILDICRRLQINSTQSVIKNHFEKADEDRSGYLNQSQFLTFVKRLKERKDIQALFRDIKHNITHHHYDALDRETFFKFLRETQKVDVDAEPATWNNVFERYARVAKPVIKPTDAAAEPAPTLMSFHGFQAFLTSAANHVLEPTRPGTYTLNRPLNEYFVSSSHNTYLVGRQVAGESSAEAYRTALQKGCRCIEIDCWDGKDGEPIVVHGRTMTSSCSFAECVKVIAKYAFVTSEFPLIISLEVHCSDQQQLRMTEIMKREFQEMLVTEPINNKEILPSPSELQRKILIKVKAAETQDKAASTASVSTGRQRSYSSPWARPVVLSDAGIPNLPLVSSPPSMSPPDRSASFWSSPRTSATSSGTVPTLPSSAEDSDSPPSITSDKRSSKKKTSNITSVLGALGVYTQGQKFSDFRAPVATRYNHIFSFAEGTFDKLCRASSENKAAMEAHNMSYLMRVYPAAKRINSSNFDPLKFWRKGVQMAALNWQTYDLGRQINDAMFAAGPASTGYVLKPETMRYEDHETSDRGRAKKKPKKQVKFTVRVIAAQQLPRPSNVGTDTNINPYVEFEMFCAEDKTRNIASGEGGFDASAPDGMSGIGSPLRKRTRILANNGYDPNWGENITMTLETKYPSLVFVRWSVFNSPDGINPTNGGPLGTFTAKLSTLQQGYRHLPLYNVNGEQFLFSTLFCKIDKESHVSIEELDEGIYCPESIPGSPAEGSTRRSIFRRAFSRTNSLNRKSEQRFRSDPEVTTISRSTTMRDTDFSLSRTTTYDRISS